LQFIRRHCVRPWWEPLKVCCETKYWPVP